MPKGIGYSDVSKMSFFGRKKRKKKKEKDTARTKKIEQRLRDAGLTEAEIRRLRGKK